MKLQKFRWSKVYESQEEELVSLLISKNIEPERQDIDEFETLEIIAANNITIWCAEGSFKLTVDGQTLSMQPGDAVPVPGGTKLEVHAGMSGCVIYKTAADKQ